MDYLKGLVFLIFFITYVYNLGKCFDKNNHTFGYRFMIGYILYTMMQAVGGGLTQIFQIDYIIYQSYMIIMVFLSCIYILRKMEFDYKKVNLKNILDGIYSHFKKYYLLYLIATILLVLNVMATNYLWMGNHQDDGWYLLKVAQAPYLQGNYNINYATGFTAPLGLVRSFNTFELDYAFWSHLLGIYPSVFCKAIMAFFNYFLIVTLFSNFIDYLFIKKEFNYKYCLLLPIIFFSLQSETLANHGLIVQQDGWHFSSAIWYGSTLVRCISPLLFFLPLFDYKKFEWKYLLWYIMCCIALISKSSQALPIIIIMTVFLLGYLIMHMKIPLIYRSLPILFIITIIIIFPETSSYMEISDYLYDGQLLTFFTSPIIILSLMIIAVSTPITIKNRFDRNWLICLTVMYTLIFVPYLNNLFLNFSIYTFVAGRTLTLLSFYTILTACFLFGKLLVKLDYHKLLCPGIYIVLACCILGTYGISYYRNIGISNFINLISNNTKLVPESSIQISSELDKIAVEKNKNLVVMSISWVSSFGNPHPLCTTLRINSTNIYPLSAIHRFSDMDQEIVYSDFNLKRQLEFETFLQYPTGKKEQKLLAKLLDDYPTDAIVTADSESAKIIEEKYNFKLCKVLDFKGENFSYYILLNDEM